VLLCIPSSAASSDTPTWGRPSLKAARIARALSADCTLQIVQQSSRMCNTIYSTGISECTIRMSIPCERRTKRDAR
jgi:hypothetical protein